MARIGRGEDYSAGQIVHLNLGVRVTRPSNGLLGRAILVEVCGRQNDSAERETARPGNSFGNFEIEKDSAG